MLALAGNTKLGTITLPLEGSVIAMITKGKAFNNRKWRLSGDDELAAYDRKVRVWISSKHSISKNLLDLLNSSSAKDIPYNGTEGVEGKY